MNLNQIRYILKYVFRLPREISILLGGINQPGSAMVVLHLDTMWKKLSTVEKMRSLFKLRWFPSDKIIEDKAKEIFLTNFFGLPEDFASELYILTAWLHTKTWSYDRLIEADHNKFVAIANVSIINNLRHTRVTSNYLHLRLFEKVPKICLLISAMVAKIPVFSIQFCLELNIPYAFQSIRASEHPNADKLIAYLYEILNIQQKIASSFHELVQHMDKSGHKSEETTLMSAEVDALKEISVIVMELKATIEKSVVLLGLTYEINDLESRKTHKQKLSALARFVPQKSKDQFYYAFIDDMISSEHLAELNNYRSGLFHKLGVAKLQPHSFVAKKSDETSLVETFMFLIDQHAKNTATLICILALLTDDLVNRKLPEVAFWEYIDILHGNYSLKLKRSGEPLDPNVQRNLYGCIPYEKKG